MWSIYVALKKKSKSRGSLLLLLLLLGYISAQRTYLQHVLYMHSHSAQRTQQTQWRDTDSQ